MPMLSLTKAITAASSRGHRRILSYQRILLIVISAFVLSMTMPGNIGNATIASAVSTDAIYLPKVTGVSSAEKKSSPVVLPTAMPFFGIYPGGNTGEMQGYANPDPRIVDQRLQELASGKPLVVHLYTAWSWHSNADMDAQVARYTGAGLKVTLTIKYSPPVGHVGDIAGYESFVRSVVSRYAGNAGVISYVIGNEANVANGSPDASDGPFAGARDAVIRGTIAARSELDRVGSTSRVGINFAVLSIAQNAEFLSDLSARGGQGFLSAVEFIGINVYPGIWQAGTGDPYRDMVSAVELGRTSINAATGLAGRPLHIREAGAPFVDEAQQELRVRAFTQAIVDERTRLNVEQFTWFDLWDSDSSSTYQFAHYGLLRSDMSHTGSFTAYKDIIARAGGG